MTPSMPTRISIRSGKPLAGMYGSLAYVISASGFATNIGYSANGGSDAAYLFASPATDTFTAYADYNNSGKPLAVMSGSFGGGYSNSASGFRTTLAMATNGGSDTADSSIRRGTTRSYAYANYNNSGQPLAAMYARHRRRLFQLGPWLRYECRLFHERRR